MYKNHYPLLDHRSLNIHPLTPVFKYTRQNFLFLSTKHPLIHIFILTIILIPQSKQSPLTSSGGKFFTVLKKILLFFFSTTVWRFILKGKKFHASLFHDYSIRIVLRHENTIFSHVWCIELYQNRQNQTWKCASSWINTKISAASLLTRPKGFK